MNINDYIANPLRKDSEGVWALEGHHIFNYSDGRSAEVKLRNALDSSTDLGSDSTTLEHYISDWPTEYHLSRKRAQLLSGFHFDSSATVLELGCGCGAVTRYLAESFNTVIAVEGSLERTRLAAARTRNLDSVTFVCAPFHRLRFKRQFNIIFCIGVFEYSAAFIHAKDPYRTVLTLIADSLTEDGILVLAIENQFGLKYFSGCREDHLGVSYAGIEGYQGKDVKVRTFGRYELDALLQEQFSYTRFFYPFPDYKIPDGVATESFLDSEAAGELFASSPPRDYFGQSRHNFNQHSTTLELQRNKILSFFANSFLVIASKKDIQSTLFPQEAIFYSSSRTREFSTVTRVITDSDGNLIFDKKSRYPHKQSTNCLPLRLLETHDAYVDSQSLLSTFAGRIRAGHEDLPSIFSSAEIWLTELKRQGTAQSGTVIVPGRYLDATWGNAFLAQGQCRLIDLEFEWLEPLPLEVVIIRTIYDFLRRIEVSHQLPASLRRYSGKRQIMEIANVLGYVLSNTHINSFLEIESRLQSVVYGYAARHQKLEIQWFLVHRPSQRLFRNLKSLGSTILHHCPEQLARRLHKYRSD